MDPAELRTRLSHQLQHRHSAQPGRHQVWATGQLRGGKNSDVELELTGAGSDYTVHALATIVDERHRVRVFTNERARVFPAVPLVLGFAMPASAEMGVRVGRKDGPPRA